MTNNSLRVQKTEDGFILQVKALPNSRNDSIRGIVDGQLKISVTAPAEQGKANKAIINYLAKTLGVRKNQVSIESGITSATKRIRVKGCDVGYLMDLTSKYD